MLLNWLNLLLVKSVLYRVIRILIVLVITLLITGSVGNALTISLLDAVVATIYYYYFDKYWYIIEKYIKHLMLLVKYRKMN